MSRTVSLPVGIVTRLVLEGKYSHLKGLQLPITKEFYTPILNELAELGALITASLSNMSPIRL